MGEIGRVKSPTFDPFLGKHTFEQRTVSWVKAVLFFLQIFIFRTQIVQYYTIV